jgi:hypothetical protein
MNMSSPKSISFLEQIDMANEQMSHVQVLKQKAFLKSSIWINFFLY